MVFDSENVIRFFTKVSCASDIFIDDCREEDWWFLVIKHNNNPATV